MGINSRDKFLTEDLVVLLRGRVFDYNIIVAFCDPVDDEPGFIAVSLGSELTESSDAVVSNSDSVLYHN